MTDAHSDCSVTHRVWVPTVRDVVADTESPIFGLVRFQVRVVGVLLGRRFNPEWPLKFDGEIHMGRRSLEVTTRSFRGTDGPRIHEEDVVVEQGEYSAAQIQAALPVLSALVTLSEFGSQAASFIGESPLRQLFYQDSMRVFSDPAVAIRQIIRSAGEDYIRGRTTTIPACTQISRTVTAEDILETVSGQNQSRLEKMLSDRLSAQQDEIATAIMMGGMPGDGIKPVKLTLKPENQIEDWGAFA